MCGDCNYTYDMDGYNDERTVEDTYEDEIVLKPSSNYRLEEARAPKCHTVLFHIDHILQLIDGILIERSNLMLKYIWR